MIKIELKDKTHLRLTLGGAGLNQNWEIYFQYGGLVTDQYTAELLLADFRKALRAHNQQVRGDFAADIISRSSRSKYGSWLQRRVDSVLKDWLS